MNTITIGDKSFPAIGYGPGIMGETFRYKIPRKGLSLFIYKIINKLYLKKRKKNEFIDHIAYALKSGFRLLDYSAAYGNMDAIGAAIKKCGIPREKLFIAARVSNRAQFNNQVREEFLNGLHDMGLEFVDLLQFHWPVTDHYLDTWKEMEKLKDEGYVKHLGVVIPSHGLVDVKR